MSRDNRHHERRQTSRTDSLAMAEAEGPIAGRHRDSSLEARAIPGHIPTVRQRTTSSP